MSPVVRYCIMALLGLANSLSVQASEESLQGAFQREHRLLESQKKMLDKRLSELTTEGEKRIGSATREVEALQREQTALTSRADALAQKLSTDETTSAPSEELSSLLDATITQAQSSLKKFGNNSEVDVAVGSGLEQKLAKLKLSIDRSLQLLAQASTIHRRTGEFFLGDGGKVEGDLVEIGHSAAFALSPKGSGALIPAGEGRLRLWEGNIGDTLDALTGKSQASEVHLFLYEAVDKPVETRKKKSLNEVLSGGGPVAYVLVALGALTLLLIGVKAWVLLRASRASEKLIGDVAGYVQKGEITLALQRCESTPNAFGKMLEAVVSNLSHGRKVVEDTISETLIRQGNAVDRFGSFVVVIAAAAPLLGLLGTVSGMIHTFDIITEFGDSDPKLLSSGISEALIDTMLGLVVAIPALLCGNLLSNWAERVKDGLEKASLQVLTAYSEFVRRGA